MDAIDSRESSPLKGTQGDMDPWNPDRDKTEEGNQEDTGRSAVLLCIDPASTSGWCVLELTVEQSVKHHRLLAWGVIISTGDNEQRKLQCFSKQLCALIDHYKPIEIVTESYMFSRFKCNGALLNAYFRVAILLAANDTEVTFVNVGDWKRFVCGKCGLKATKEQVQCALNVSHDCKFPDKVRHPVSGRLVKFKHDVSDALALVIYHVAQRHKHVMIGFDLTSVSEVLATTL